MNKFILTGILLSFVGAQFSEAKQYDATCKAGPFRYGADIGECAPEYGTHIANGYDRAYKCALNTAMSYCKIDGGANCRFLTLLNHGAQRDSSSTRAMYNCVVQVYVTGQ